MFRLVAPILLLALTMAAPAAAEPFARDAAPRAWHAGVNLRPELGVRPLRVDAGLRFGAVDTILVVDPFWWTDGVFDLDLLGSWQPGDTYGLLAGWRTTSIELDTGSQHQERLLLGAGAALPAFLGGSLRPHVGFELAVLLVKHGGGLPTESFPLDRTLFGHLTAGAFLRVDYGHAL